MATYVKLWYGVSKTLTFVNLNALNPASYGTSNPIVNPTDNDIGVLSSNYGFDVLVQVTIADVVATGNKQIVLYVSTSIDGTNYSDNQTGNEQYALKHLGTIPLNGTGPWISSTMSVAAAFGGIIPNYFKVVAFNDAGIKLATSGNSAKYMGVRRQTSLS